MSYAARGTVNFAEIAGNKDAIIHLGIAGYTAQYEVSPALSNNTGDTLDPAEPRATIFSFRSAGGGLNNIYRAQIGGATVGATVFGASAPNTASVQNKAVGLEGILALNNFKIQGEYSNANYSAHSSNSRTTDTAHTDAIQADVYTGYIEALWLVTGEKYADFYKKGAFGAIKPKAEYNLDSGSGLGAWELGIRLDSFDVNGTLTGVGKSRFQGAVTGGTGAAYDNLQTCKIAAGTCNPSGGASTWTLGAKWVLNPNMLIKANYSYTNFDNAFRPIDLKNNNASNATQKSISGEDLFMIRGQYMF
jgi:phosphate-selective porin OprO/OprP